jgi:membrane protein
MEKRGFIRLNLITLCFTIATIVFLLIALACIVALPVALNHLLLPGVTSVVLEVPRWPRMLVLVAFGLTLIYRYGPSRAEPRWQWSTWGSAFTAIVWLAASALFSWYSAHFGSFNKTTVRSGPSSDLVLISAKLNAEIAHQTARDSTTGRPKPLGVRAAKMADMIGSAQA